MADLTYNDPYAESVSSLYYQNNGKQLSDAAKDFWKQTGFGSIRTAIGDNIYGINHRQTPGSIGTNRDYYGLTFLTRPRMNFSTENLRTIREFGPLLTTNRNSYPRIIRCLLDPKLALEQQISSDFVDEQQAFIPLLTNTLLSCTGWPDMEAQTFTAADGFMKESYSFVDSSVRLFGTYDISLNFRNIQGDPIILMFLMWIYYMSFVYLGDIIPYPEMILNNEIDYMTRIYRVVLDPSRRFVTKIAATGASFPTNVPVGAAINHDADHPLNQSNAQISIQFRSNGVTYMDPILIDEFNRTQAIYNKGMSPDNFTASTKSVTLPNGDTTTVATSTNPNYKQVPLTALPLFNNRGYPRINPQTHELEWWVSPDEYALRLPDTTTTAS